jgi:hypothetical protein
MAPFLSLHDRHQRNQYRLNRELALTHKDKYFSVTLDGMDQMKTAVPHYGFASSAFLASKRLALHNMGV